MDPEIQALALALIPDADRAQFGVDLQLASCARASVKVDLQLASGARASVKKFAFSALWANECTSVTDASNASSVTSHGLRQCVAQTVAPLESLRKSKNKRRRLNADRWKSACP